jgi:NAD(P)-dependent dehydrogenase (short-subunit alcohol dehydrogenase family)
MGERADVTATESLNGRVALVTGGTRGIGAAISTGRVRRGAAVASGYITWQAWAVNGGLDM